MLCAVGQNRRPETMMSIIRCNSLDDLVAICEKLYRDGFVFEADASKLTISITGY
jgi:hypothetical protein